MLSSSLSQEKKQENSSLFGNPWEAKSEIIIEVTNNKIVCTGPRGNQGFIYETNLLFNGQTVPLLSISHDYPLKANPHSEIKFRLNCLDKTEVTSLSQEKSNNLLVFLMGSIRKGSNCMDFINDIFFGFGSEKLNSLSSVGSSFLKTDTKLKVGDVIALSRDENLSGACHDAIHIGNNLYMSLARDDGQIIITTLEQMKLIWDAKNAIVIFPASTKELENVPFVSYQV